MKDNNLSIAEVAVPWIGRHVRYTPVVASYTLKLQLRLTRMKLGQEVGWLRLILEVVGPAIE